MAAAQVAESKEDRFDATEGGLSSSEDLLSWTSDNLTDDGSARSTLFGVAVGDGDLAELLEQVAVGVEVLADASACVRIAFAAVKGIWERYSAVTYGILKMCIDLCRTLLDATVQLKKTRAAFEEGRFLDGFEAQVKDVEETVDRIMGYAKDKSYVGKVKFFIISKSLHKEASEKANELVKTLKEMDRDTQLMSSMREIKELTVHAQRRVDLHEEFGAEGEGLENEQQARTAFEQSTSATLSRMEDKMDAQDARAREAAMLEAQALRLQARAVEVKAGISSPTSAGF